jgi:hypothetical protein
MRCPGPLAPWLPNRAAIRPRLRFRVAHIMTAQSYCLLRRDRILEHVERRL